MLERHHWVTKALIAILLINALATAYLVSVVIDQQRRIQTLERNDSIKQSVDKLNSKYDSLKQRLEQRVEGFFR